VLHGAELIREAFSDPAFSGRNATEASAFVAGDKYGIIQASGDVWAEQRRFAANTLRNFGFGKSSMQEIVTEEARELCEWLKINGTAPIKLQHHFSLGIINCLWRIVAGHRFEHDDPQLTQILEKLNRLTG